LVGWLVGQLLASSPACSVGWLVDWLVAWSVANFTNQLASQYDILTNPRQWRTEGEKFLGTTLILDFTKYEAFFMFCSF
jgi:hypothetical protein